jgi:hypothetical protein
MAPPAWRINDATWLKVRTKWRSRTLYPTLTFQTVRST